MTQRQKIDQILNSTESRDVTVVKGWVRTRRDSKTFSFIEINDGSCLKNIQVIADNTLDNYEDVKKITTGSAVSITGQLVASKG
ncbi:MAG: asparagine--tRNA ligase, partial [Deltaproteobacteria bacterium]|nr:asparagine--tRNA ligase [Deltaproteobacteria bacterium]